MEDKKKYNCMENVLQRINKRFIFLSEDETKLSNLVLKEVIHQILLKMKEDSLFSNLFSAMYYGGSFYDGLRIGSPEEFDLDLLLHLPVIAKPQLTQSNIPGFMNLQLKEFDKFLKQPEAKGYKGFEKLLEKDYLMTDKVRQWLEGVVTKALNTFSKQENYFIINCADGNVKILATKSGPAITLKITGNVRNQYVKIDVDLVPCFVFDTSQWPGSPYRPKPSVIANTNERFLLVPKNPTRQDCNPRQRYWRLSFQQQEALIIHNTGTLKPALKLLKKLRDNFNDKIIASYFIKTIFLWEASNNKEIFDNKNSLSYVFMTMLKKYQMCIENKRIDYFWNKKYNLIDQPSSTTLENYANRLKRMINKLEENLDNEYLIAQYLLSPAELDDLKMNNLVKNFQASRI